MCQKFKIQIIVIGDNTWNRRRRQGLVEEAALVKLLVAALQDCREQAAQGLGENGVQGGGGIAGTVVTVLQGEGGAWEKCDNSSTALVQGGSSACGIGNGCLSMRSRCLAMGDYALHIWFNIFSEPFVTISILSSSLFLADLDWNLVRIRFDGVKPTQSTPKPCPTVLTQRETESGDDRVGEKRE